MVEAAQVSNENTALTIAAPREGSALEAPRPASLSLPAIMRIAAALDVAKRTNKFQFLPKKGIACHPDPAPRQECNAYTPSGAHALSTPPAWGVEGSSAPAPTKYLFDC